MAQSTFVIVGASLAGAKAAEALRGNGFDGRILLIGDEPDPPYERPPLSKGYLMGKQDRETIFVHPSQWYADQGIDLRLNTIVTAIDRDRKAVTVSGGKTIGYDKLLLVTGASPHHLAVPGADLDSVLYLRRVGDCERIQRTFRSASRIVLVGGGWIGLEVAAAAREAGVEATVLVAGELPLLRVLGPQIAPVFADLHREHGVDLRLGARVTEIVGESEKVAGVRLADGTRIDADTVVVGIGAAPNTQLAAESSLQVNNGVVVDASCGPPTRTSTRPAMWPTPFTRCWASTSAWSTGPMPFTSLGRPRGRCWASPRSTTASRTSSPTSTTWAWSTRATPSPVVTRTWWCAAISQAGSSSPSGWPTVASWPA